MALLPLLTSRSLSVLIQASGAVTALTSTAVTALTSTAVDTSGIELLSGGSDSNVDVGSAASSESYLSINHLLTLGVVPSLLQLLRPPFVDDAVLTNNVVGSMLNISHLSNGKFLFYFRCMFSPVLIILVSPFSSIPQPA